MNLGEYLRRLSAVLGREARVGFFGLGRTNSALIKEYTKLSSLPFTVRDESGRALEGLPSQAITIRGKDCFLPLFEDVIFLSPSIRRERRELDGFRKKEVIFLSDTELFFYGGRKNVFAVTGSDGKSSTVYIASRLLQGHFKSSVPAGNYGLPLCLLREEDVPVCELSSFNLRYIKPRTERSLITNIRPNHLNWHDSFSEYRKSKLSILANAEKRILYIDDPILKEEAKNWRPFALYSMKMSDGELRREYNPEHTVSLKEEQILLDGEELISSGELKRKEKHFLLDFLGAVALCSGLITKEDVRRAAEEFTGLPHRCECFLTKGGISYVDSSIDTTPERCAATLESLPKGILLILGGRGKGLSYSPIIPLIKEKVKRIAVYGEAAAEIRECLCREALRGIEVGYFETLSEGIDFAIMGASSQDTVLLSPAATAYGEFRSFEERGDYFKSYIKKLLKI